MQNVKRLIDHSKGKVIPLKITREYLANYICLESRIKSIRRRLRYFDTHPLGSSHGVVKGSMETFPFAQCHFVVSGSDVKSDENRNKKVSQLIVELRSKEALYEKMKIDIEMFVENTEMLSLEESTVLRLKYIDGYTDEQIGCELGYDRNTISKKIDKIIEKCELSHNSHS